MVLAASGHSVFVPTDVNILDALLDGIEVLNDCHEGICGSCETKVCSTARSTNATSCSPRRSARQATA